MLELPSAPNTLGHSYVSLLLKHLRPGCRALPGSVPLIFFGADGHGPRLEGGDRYLRLDFVPSLWGTDADLADPCQLRDRAENGVQIC